MKKTKRVYACYLLEGDPVDVLKAVSVSLDADGGPCRSAYFHLSEGEDQDVEGSHFGDEDVTVHLYPSRPGAQLLILTGRATGLRNPYITPPLILEGEANGPWGSVTATEDGALAHARAACEKKGALPDRGLACDAAALAEFLAKEAAFEKKMRAITKGG